MEYAIGELARLSGVTVRTLHHYDAIGLLRPGHRTTAGYRTYRDGDLDRLQRILAYRELGFGLDEIAELLAGKGDPVQHLKRQRELVLARVDHLHRLLDTIERTMEAHAMGIRLTPQEMFEVFGEHDPTQYADEAEQRWSETDAYRESSRRTAQYTKADWLQIKAEEAAVGQQLIDALVSGVPSDAVQAMDAAEAHRQFLGRWFYPCPTAMHRGLADMYLADPRLTRHYEDRATGLAQYVHDAIHTNADRQGAATG
jgi:DNA-binding transcriptional MerR regulator